jgi:hypothetical protein
LKERESNKKKLNKEDPLFSLEAKEAETPYGETLEWTKS